MATGGSHVAERRRYTKAQKLSAVMAAEMVGVTVAAEQAGIPHQTVSYWLDAPEFSEYRRRAREDLVEEVKVAAHRLWRRVIETAPSMEPRDALFGADKATAYLQLLTGAPTDRLETRDVTETLDDHERAALRDLLTGVLAETPDAVLD